MPPQLKQTHKGPKFTVTHCEGALESLEDALTSVTPHKKKTSLVTSLCVLIERLANGGRLSKDNFPPEGNLPHSRGKFHAFKKLPIRAYCWLSDKHPNTYFISHYKYKDKKKLDSRDTDKVCRNWKKIEE